MARAERPLLSANHDDDPINDTEDTEQSSLLPDRHVRTNASRWRFWREVALLLWAVIATIVVVVLAVLYQQRISSHAPPADSREPRPAKPTGKRNLVFMVSDGMGPASLSLTRSFRQNITGLPFSDTLVLDRHLIGQSRTRSSNSLVTDSAAGATAFSCGKKSYNGAISMLPDHQPCGTVLEAAKRAGYLTGLVVTTRITDATPACFGSHVNMRSEEDSIARQLIGEHPLGHMVDLVFGGGRCHFLPQGQPGSCRKDDADVVKTAKQKGYSYLNTRAQFDELQAGSKAELPILGLFASTDIPFEIDRRSQNDKYPSLDEMAEAALQILESATADSDKGFFLLIEGSRIDHAGHGNDPAAQVHEVLAYDQAFSSVVDFLEKSDTDGVLVATSDHETGGLALARQLDQYYPEYLWLPGVLARTNSSSEFLAAQLAAFASEKSHHLKELEDFVRRLIREGLGIDDASEAEIASLVAAKDVKQVTKYFMAEMVSRRAQLGWSTHGHSAVDVNIYTSDRDYAAALAGNHENTEVGEFMADFLDVDLAAVTHELQEKAKSFVLQGSEEPWLGRSVGSPAANSASEGRSGGRVPEL